MFSFQIRRRVDPPSSKHARGRAITISLLFGLGLGLTTPTSTLRAGPPIDPRFDYLEMFELTRGVMTRKNARKLLNDLFVDQLRVNPSLARKYGFAAEKIKGFTETQLMLLLQEAPEIRGQIREYLRAVPAQSNMAGESEALIALREKWRDRFTKLFEDKALLERFLQRNNPLEPFVLEPAPGKIGFGRLETYLTQPITLRGRLRPADNAEQAIVDFIDGAEDEIRFNVFDFDLDSIADAFIRAHKKGRKVLGGIDKGVIDVRPEVKAVYDKLVAAGIPVAAVDSVGLNHQKLIVRDWSKPTKAATLMSTGNFTKSCLSPGGDLAGTSFHSPKSVPNSNMLKIIRSDELAAVVHHEITKTVDPNYALRGRDYPISGAYQIFGEELVPGKKRWMTVAFTPNGGLEDINQNFIGRVIKSTPGPSYTAQFAWASKKNEAALLEDAVACKKAGTRFELHAVGDTPFAMQKWSVFLSIAGYRLQGEGEKKGYVRIPDSENKWLQTLGEKDYAEVLRDLKIAPLRYGNHSVRTPDGAFKLTAKIHLKVFVKGPPGEQVGIFGSFNFSEGAENNQEYIVAIVDDETNEILQATVTSLSDDSPRTIGDEAERRNIAREFDPEEGTQVDAAKAGRNANDARLKCERLLQRVTVGVSPATV